MPRQVEYHPEAKSEIRKSANWYDDKVDGLGLEFLLEVRNAESQIVQNPELWPVYEAGTRRYMMKKFPFAVIYLVSGLKMQIVAVAHCKRNPGYWKDRLNEKGRETLGSVFTFLFSNNANLGVKNVDIGAKNGYFGNINLNIST